MNEYRGHAASAGIAIGPAYLYVPGIIPGDECTEPADAARQLERLTEAVAEARSQLANIHAKTVAKVGRETAEVFLAHREFLDDPELLRMVKEQISSDGVLARTAVEAAFETYTQMLEAMDQEYYRDRALDLRDVSRRVRRILAGVQDQETLAKLTSPVVIVART
ncbi:MAG TPA: phosphoenolpyruvate-utilizing N-terminal domain-containing protein [Anaerolineae bacterium]|nr:phosphoenolpyruvate-utilizing N-terminal domain-containing protein [Anaerolineae bacterium]